MNKEEQQENLYRILLTRNQINFQIIRKYRRKSNNYHKRILISSHNCITHHKQMKEVSLQIPQNITTTQLAVQPQPQNPTTPRRCQHLLSRGPNTSTQKQKSEQKQRNKIRLPSIVGYQCQEFRTNQNQTQQNQICKQKQKQNIVKQNNNDYNQKDKLQTSQFVENQPEMRFNGLELSQNGAVLHVFKLSAQNEELQSNLINNTKLLQIKKQPKIGKISQKIKNSTNINTQSVRVTNPDSTIGNSSTNPNGHNYKRQGRLSNSHKTLLNLHEIVFETKPKTKLQQIAQNRRQDRYSNNPSQAGYKIKQTSKYKYKQKYREKQKQRQKEREKEKDREKQKLQEEKENIMFYHSSQAINNRNHINTIIEHMNLYANKSKNNTQFSDLHHLIANSNNINTNVNANTNSNCTITNSNSNNINSKYNSISISALSYLNSNINTRNNQPKNEQFSDQNQKQKQSQLLPQIHKLKEVRLNFHKLLKKQHMNMVNNNNCNGSNSGNTNTTNNNNINNNSNGNSKNIAIPSSAHNYSYSLSSIYHNNTQPILQQSEISRRAFRIEAIPVHQIKWI